MRLSFLAAALPFAAFALDPPPPTEKRPVTDTIHGVAITDNYRWLEDQNSPDTRAWIDAQNRHTESYYASIRGRETVRARLAPFFRQDSVTAPTVRDGRYYFMRRLESETRSSICARTGFSGPVEVLIAPSTISQDESVSIGLMSVSRDGKLLAYFVRKGGEDETEIRFFDIRAKQDLPDRLPRARRFGVDLHPNNKTVFYSILTPEGSRVMRHEMGTAVSADKFIFSKGKGLVPTDGVSLSDDGRFLLLTLNYGTSSRSEVRFMDLSRGFDVVTVAEGIDARFFPTFVDGRLYIRTNWKAPNWRVLRVDPQNPSIEKAQEIIPERQVALGGLTYSGRRLFAGYLENALPRVLQFDAEGKALGELKAPGAGVMSTPAGDWDSSEVFFSFSSFSEPGTTYRLNVANGERDIWHRSKAQPRVPIEVKQVWYTSKDGTKVPMWLAHRQGLKIDGNRPVFLTGYGGFNLPQLPSFNATAELWAEMDGVYALPNLRGGNEFGEKWHEAGMFGKKQNVFDDFIAAAEWLIANRYTKPARITVSGGSNGGLLVGAMFTQRPDLFGAVLCGVPLLDMIRYQRTLLGRFWVSEYGSAEDAQQFPFLLKYSPYHNVRPGVKYPAVLLHTGDSDTRVDPMHARKMTALLQATVKEGGPILLKYDTKAGHSGGLPVDRQIEETADRLLFALNETGALR